MGAHATLSSVTSSCSLLAVQVRLGVGDEVLCVDPFRVELLSTAPHCSVS